MKSIFLLLHLFAPTAQPYSQQIDSNVFEFTGGIDSYAKFDTDVQLVDFTACLSYRQLSNNNSSHVKGIFSYNTRHCENCITIFVLKKLFVYHIAGHAKRVTYKKVLKDWNNICYTFSEFKQERQLYINGVIVDTTKTHQSIRSYPPGIVVLGQDQDLSTSGLPGGGFDKRQAFHGQIKNVFMWNKWFSPNQIQQISRGIIPNEYGFINWTHSTWRVGSITLKPIEKLKQTY